MQDIYHSILQQYWGYADFRGIQREIIESICNGKDTLGLMPTGGGKSITFQVPAMALNGTCVVFTPLIALMKDQVDSLLKRGIRASAIHSGLPHYEITKILDTAVLGGYKILYISPERLNSELFITKIKKMKVSFITVDEAHCISYWGYDFRPSYLKIKEIRTLKPDAPILALTASATPEAVKDIQKQLAFRNENVFKMSFERKNLCYMILNTSLREKAMVHLLENIPGTAIIYTRNRENCQKICDDLCKKGYTATFYHAGLADSVKNERQNGWMANEFRIMVATNAFGMGIDKPDVRLVIHMDLPDSLEAYYQEAGRAGRDGLQSYAIIPMDGKELQQFHRRTSQMYPDEEYVKEVYEKVCFYLQMAIGDGLNVTREFNLEEFCRLFHTHPIMTNNALLLLNNAGYIKYADEDDCCSRLKIIATRNELYKAIDKEKEPVINCILRHYGGIFVEYCYIEEALIAQKTNIPAGLIYNTLKLLSKANIVDYIPKKRIARITFTQRRVDKEDVVLPYNVYEERKAKYLERAETMEMYCTSNQKCRNRILLEYFGEDTGKDCGQCDICESNKPMGIPDDEYERIHEDIVKQFEKGPIRVFDLRYRGINTDKYEKVIQDMREAEEIVLDGIYIKLNR